jgi:hypothetical protein
MVRRTRGGCRSRETCASERGAATPNSFSAANEQKTFNETQIATVLEKPIAGINRAGSAGTQHCAKGNIASVQRCNIWQPSRRN